MKHDHCKHKTDIISLNSSSAKGQDVGCTGLTNATTSTVSDDTAADGDCNDFPIPSTGAGLTPEVNIPSDVILSLTCFVAAE